MNFCSFLDLVCCIQYYSSAILVFSDLQPQSLSSCSPAILNQTTSLSCCNNTPLNLTELEQSVEVLGDVGALLFYLNDSLVPGRWLDMEEVSLSQREASTRGDPEEVS